MFPAQFNPANFFEKTAHYASAGRGQFSLARLPSIFNPAGMGQVYLPALSGNHIRMAEELLTRGVMAKAFTTPMMSLMTHDAFSYTGPKKSIAYQQNFGEFSVEFLTLGKTPEEAQSLLYLFNRWQEIICGPRRVPVNNAPVLPAEFFEQDVAPTFPSDTVAFDVEYYDNYITEGELQIFSPNNTSETPNAVPIIKIALTELYPLTITPINSTWDSPDSPVTFTVTFHFYYARVIV